jgi:hypothetical protein
LRATVGSNGLAKARVLDVERQGYWIAYDEYFPGQNPPPVPLVGSKKLVEWSEFNESGHVSSTSTMTAALGANTGVDPAVKPKPALPTVPPKQKRDGPRKPERRRMMVPPAPSVGSVDVDGASTSRIVEAEDDGQPKLKKMRSNIAFDEKDASPTSLGYGAPSSPLASSASSNSTAPLETDKESARFPKVAAPAVAAGQLNTPQVVLPNAKTVGAGQEVEEEQQHAGERANMSGAGTKRDQGSAANAGTKLKKKGPRPKKTPAQSSGGAPSAAKRGSPPGEAQGLPKSSDAWLLPQSEHIPLSHPSAVQHKAPPHKFKLKIPDYQRLLTIPNEAPGEPPHILVLSVAASTIPNGGRGLYCTYRGPNAYWKVSNYVDLGCYGPHTANDIKPDYIMEIKNFCK